MNNSANDISHYQYLDALRGIAFLGVLFCHTALNTAPFSGIALAGAGRYGVQLFFLVSAVTLMLSWNKRSTGEQSPVRNFYIRRIFRIAPMFWIGALFYLLIAPVIPENVKYWAPHGIGWPQVVSTLLFLHIWSPVSINAVVPGGWSIGIEMTFYLLVPVIVHVIRSLRAAFYAMAIALLLMTIANRLAFSYLSQRLPMDENYLIAHFIYFWFPSEMPVFLIGVTLFWILQNRDWLNKLRVASRSFFLAAFAVCLMVIFSYRMPSFFSPQIVYALSFSILIVALAAQPFRLLVNHFTCSLGAMSYSCYLTHFIVLSLVVRLLKPVSFSTSAKADGALRFLCLSILALGGTMALSHLMYRWVEQPSIKMGRRLILRLERTVLKKRISGQAGSVQAAE